MTFDFELFEAEIGARGPPLAFEFAPEDLDEVGFWAAGRQPSQAGTLADPVRDAGSQGVAGMDRLVVEDDRARVPAPAVWAAKAARAAMTAVEETRPATVRKWR